MEMLGKILKVFRTEIIGNCAGSKLLCGGQSAEGEPRPKFPSDLHSSNFKWWGTSHSIWETHLVQGSPSENQIQSCRIFYS